jgi:ATP-dependent protease ClpP protease subunit
MKRKGMPKAFNKKLSAEVRFDVSEGALSKWDSSIKALAPAGENIIEVFEVIGLDYWTGDGVTAKGVSAKLREFRGEDVTVNINSPGGDMFEGLAIYNVLREYPGDVNVKILGMAASAASIIALAGDHIEIGASAFYMIHNAWIMVAANRNGLREYADYLEPFDNAMAEIYAARTGSSKEDMLAIMDAESWINGKDAIEQGFADALLASDEVLHDTGDSASAAAKLDRALAQSGMPRSERRKLLQQVKNSTPNATEKEEDMPSAVSEELLNLSSQLRDIFK